jgi:hypothetical protein
MERAKLGDIDIQPPTKDTKTTPISESVCVECETKFKDSSLKVVTICPICQRPVCDMHRVSKLAYIPDFKHTSKAIKEAQEIIRNQKDCLREKGHPCLPYTLDFWKQYDLEKERKKQRIKNQMDGFGYITDEEVEAVIDRMPSSSTDEEEYSQSHSKILERALRKETDRRRTATSTYNNKFNYNFPIPAGIYWVDEYYDRLNEARTLAEVDDIIHDYRRGIRKQPVQEQQVMKKKHWWQK